MCTGLEIISLVGGGLSAFGQFQSAQAASNQAKFEAKVAEQRAQREREIGLQQSQDFERSERANLARQRALRAASGVEIGQGTPLLVDRSTNVEIELGRQRVISGADTRSTRLRQSAELSRTAAKNRKTAGFLKAGTTLLTTASNVSFG